MGADFDASNWAASRPELGLAALTPRLFSFTVLWGSRGKKKEKKDTVFFSATFGASSVA
jgi:hypothetical protein